MSSLSRASRIDRLRVEFYKASALIVSIIIDLLGLHKCDESTEGDCDEYIKKILSDNERFNELCSKIKECETLINYLSIGQNGIVNEVIEYTNKIKSFVSEINDSNLSAKDLFAIERRHLGDESIDSIYREVSERFKELMDLLSK